MEHKPNKKETEFIVYFSYGTWHPNSCLRNVTSRYNAQAALKTLTTHIANITLYGATQITPRLFSYLHSMFLQYLRLLTYYAFDINLKLCFGVIRII